MSNIISTIILALISALSGGGLTALFLIKSKRAKAAEEVEGERIRNIESARDTFDKALKTLSDLLDKSTESIKHKEKIIVEKDQRILELTAKVVSLQDDMCVHKGCKLRKPHTGQGEKWYEDHKDDANLGADYLSVEWLLKQWRKNSGNDSSESTDQTEQQ